ncbi:LysR family transcriptional regulator [Pandoraea pneumonica]|jgi:putative oxidoreductase|uniref:LysR family transcriptional regulator n=1 Tax=Pandoraea pneumonica TaxID=2508299 RepID=A0A5E4X067_9BURK|nr:DoxX family protein [Pandoraea pneumonica]VVE29681.1 LysR family transcriptional regulator [Pandoraea pneumonica]
MIDTKTAPYAALLLRVSLGILFLAHLSLKVFVFTIPGFVGFFGSLGLPPFLAYVTMAVELVGGLMLITGFYARWAALPLAVLMLGTIVSVHGHNGWMFANKGGGWEFPAFWLVALLVVALLGDGAWSVRSAGRAPKA